MGYPMALNLRKGLGPSSTLLICDVVEDAISRFLKDAEGKGPVEVVKTGFEAIQKAVRSERPTPKQKAQANMEYRIW